MTYIPQNKYDEIKEVLPILCVDLIVRNNDRYLLVKRGNAPLKEEWWVVGGRIFKGEEMTEAAHRKAKEEAGIAITDLNPIGYYSEVYNEGSHTVSVVFSAETDDTGVVLDDQSSEYKWSPTLPKRFLNRLLFL